MTDSDDQHWNSLTTTGHDRVPWLTVSLARFPQFLSPDLPIPANWRRQRIELRPGYFEITGHQPIHHPQQLNAVYIQLQGMPNDDPCEECVNGGRRPFAYCVSIRREFGGACGNCLWRHRASGCKHSTLFGPQPAVGAAGPASASSIILPTPGRRAGTRARTRAGEDPPPDPPTRLRLRRSSSKHDKVA
ncbi:hypothetical protein XPA_000863 [Xanthoria parietina]